MFILPLEILSKGLILVHSATKILTVVDTPIYSEELYHRCSIKWSFLEISFLRYLHIDGANWFRHVTNTRAWRPDSCRAPTLVPPS